MTLLITLLLIVIVVLVKIAYEYRQDAKHYREASEHWFSEVKAADEFIRINVEDEQSRKEWLLRI